MKGFLIPVGWAYARNFSWLFMGSTWKTNFCSINLVAQLIRLFTKVPFIGLCLPQ